MLHVTEVRHIRDYRLWVQFSGGLEGEVDLCNELEGGIFMPLRDTGLFRQVPIDPDIHTISWPNGADFASEFPHALLLQHQVV